MSVNHKYINYNIVHKFKIMLISWLCAEYLNMKEKKGKERKEFGKTAFRKFSDKQNTYAKMLIIKQNFIFSSSS